MFLFVHWIYTNKVDTKHQQLLQYDRHRKEYPMSDHKINNRYDEEFKKSLVSLHQNGKSQSQLCKEYGVSMSALSKWIRMYSEIKTEDGDVLTAKQIKELQKRNAQLEEENLILKKAIAIFTPHSSND